MGFSNSRLAPVNRLSGRPTDMAWGRATYEGKFGAFEPLILEITEPTELLSLQEEVLESAEMQN